MSIPYCEFFLNNHGVYIMMPLELTVVEIARAECQRQKIPISKLEKDLGHGNGWLNPKKISTFKLDDAFAIADYLNISLDELCGRKPQNLNQNENKMMCLLHQLNEDGKKEALNRVEEMTQLQRYTEDTDSAVG